MTKEILINTLVCLTRSFAAAADLGNDRRTICTEMGFIETDLNEKFGMDWDEIEAIEIAVMQ